MASLKEDLKKIAFDNIEGMNEEEARYFLMNDAIPESGSVGGMIYYSETEPFAQTHYDEIIESLHGVYGKEIPSETINSLNNLAWAAWEIEVLQNSSFIDEIVEEAIEQGIVEKKPEYENEEEVKEYLEIHGVEKINNQTLPDLYDKFMDEISEDEPEDMEESIKWVEENNPYSNEKFEEWVIENILDEEIDAEDVNNEYEMQEYKQAKEREKAAEIANDGGSRPKP